MRPAQGGDAVVVHPWAEETYIADGQGSIRQLTDNAGTVTDTYDYYAFGEELASTGSTENSFRYTGEQWEPNAGFYHLRARYMDPSVGRFVSVDPSQASIRAPSSGHRYAYVQASPVSLRDPAGLMSLAEVGGIFGLIHIFSGIVVPVAGETACQEGPSTENAFAVFQKDGGINESGATEGTLYWVAAPWHDSYRRDLRHFCNCPSAKGNAIPYSAFSGGDENASPIPSNYPLGGAYYVTLKIVQEQFYGFEIQEGVQPTTTDVGGEQVVMIPDWGTIRARIEGAGGRYYFHDPVPPDRNTHGCLGTTTAFMERLYSYAEGRSGRFHVLVSSKKTCLSEL